VLVLYSISNSLASARAERNEALARGRARESESEPVQRECV